MAVKVTKGQISDGTISENTCIEDYYLCGKFHGFMKKCTIFWLCRLYTILAHCYLILCMYYSCTSANPMDKGVCNFVNSEILLYTTIVTLKFFIRTIYGGSCLSMACYWNTNGTMYYKVPVNRSASNSMNK